MIKAVLFDLDGVLLDTEGTYTDFWRDIDRRYPTGVPDFALAIKGSTLDTILNTHFPSDDVRDDIRLRLRRFESSMPFVLFDGAASLIEGLRRAGTAMAIVTSSPAAKMSRVMAELPVLARNIDILVTDADVTRSKPDPEGYLLAARRLGALPSSFAVVEDSIAGLQAGRQSGGRVVAIATTNPRHRVEPLADFTVDSIADLTLQTLLS